MRDRTAGLADRLFVLPSPEELARAAAGRLWGIVRERAAAAGRSKGAASAVHVALSGGSTPRRTYETLSSEPYRDRFPWAAVHFHQVDERFVPPGDPRSNGRLLREALFSRVPVPPGNVHLVDTTLPGPAAAARKYEEELRRAFPDPPGGFPRFDAVLLGLGADGHTASLFPGDEALAERTAWVVGSTGGEPAIARVTLTLPVLCAAAQVIFLVEGRAKAESLRRLVEGTGDAPAARVVPRRGAITILADREAAGESGAGTEKR